MKVFCIVAALLGCAQPGLALRSLHKGKGSPVEQVITLLEDLQSQTEEEGKEEAKIYDTFACFCKDNTQEKSEAIMADQTEIDTQTAELEEKTSLKQDLQKEIEDLNNLIDTTDKEMADAQAKRDEEKTKYEAKAADLAKAVSSVEGAVARMKGAEDETSLTQVKAAVRKSLIMADVLSVSPKHVRALESLLQGGDDGVPESDFSFHSGDLISTMEDLDKQYIEKKEDVDDEEAKAVSSHNSYMASKLAQKESAQGDLETRNEDLNQCLEDIGTAETALSVAKAALADEEQYLRDLTAKCELKAREFDQRSTLRNEELTALAQAMTIITEKVSDKDAVNERALLQRPPASSAAPKASQSPSPPVDADSDDDVDPPLDDDLSFLQLEKPRRKIGTLLRHAREKEEALEKMGQQPSQQKALETTKGALRKTAGRHHGVAKDKVIALLKTKGQTLASPVLTSMAMKVAADPFIKVKNLIQNLVRKLVQEATDEASQKGWCDTNMGKAESERTLQHTEVSKTNAELEALEAQRDKLEDDIAALTEEISGLTDSLSKTTAMRAAEKADNLDVLSKAKEGLDAITEAIGVLKDFYDGAKKAKGGFVQVSPVDQDFANYGGGETSGAYKGNQAASSGIIGMMDVIKSDFERTIKVTKQDEFDASREFAEFSKTTKASLSSKETEKGQCEADLSATNAGITEGMEDLKTHQDLLDGVLQEIESLKPACIDTGMSYSERVQKREEEIEALKNALCILDTDGVEEGC